MTTILISERTYTAAMAPHTPQTIGCPKCRAPVQVTKIRTGMIVYTCSCGTSGLVSVERMETTGAAQARTVRR